MDAEDCVLLVGRPVDAEFEMLARRLRRAGVPVVRTDRDTFAGRAVLDPLTGVVELAGRTLRPSLLWARFLDAPGVTRALTDQVSLWGRAVIGGPGPGGLRQARDAQEAGVRVPWTLVTTDPGTVLARRGADRFVVKAVDEHVREAEPGRHEWSYPAIADRAGLAAWAPTGVPVVVREYVPHTAEFRVYAIGTELVGFQVGKSRPEDLWLRPDEVSVTPAPLDEQIRATVRRLADRWALAYGAFDLLATPDGPVFLEVNVSGDWRWYERRAGGELVTEAAARYVADRYASAANRRPRAEILSFLGIS